MGSNPLRELLNRLRWEADAHCEDVRLTILTREGSSAREEVIGFSSVTAITPAGLVVADGTFLPYHRVTSVRRGGDVLWRARVEDER